MKAFDVHLNGSHLMTAGIEESVSILHLILEIHGGILNLIVRGQDLVAREDLGWSDPGLKIGDEITVKIVETGRASPPEYRVPFKA